MAVWLDIIGSFLFGSLLVLNVLRLNGDMTDQSYRTILEYTAQSGALSVALIVDEDSRKAGYGVTGTAITIADTADIEFLSDLGADGSVDTLRYYLGDLVTTTPNPQDRMLCRVLNSDIPDTLRLGLTRFAVSYFDVDGDSLVLPATLADIRRIRVDITVESTSAYDTTYARAFMQLRIRPKNLGT